MKKAEKDEVLKILHECITHPEVDEDDEALVDYRQAKLMIMGIQEEPSFEIKHMEEKKEKGGCGHARVHKKKMEPTLQERKEIAIATLQVVKNGTQESEMLQVALDWAIETLRKAEE